MRLKVNKRKLKTKLKLSAAAKVGNCGKKRTDSVR
jgi:hypothetical protein